LWGQSLPIRRATRGRVNFGERRDYFIVTVPVVNRGEDAATAGNAENAGTEIDADGAAVTSRC
jgi:hypothetical protein